MIHLEKHQEKAKVTQQKLRKIQYMASHGLIDAEKAQEYFGMPKDTNLQLKNVNFEQRIKGQHQRALPSVVGTKINIQGVAIRS